MTTILASSGTRRLDERWVTVRGLRIYYRVCVSNTPETDEPVILVPGLNVSSRHNVRLAEYLAPHVSVYALDLPGYGQSDKPRHYYTLRDLSDFLADWMRALELRPAVLFGSSYSAQIVADFAVRHSDQISRAILASPTIDPSSRPLPKLVLKWRINEHREPPQVGQATQQDYQDVSRPRAAFTFWQMVSDHIENRLAAIRVPTLVVRGGKDPIVGPRWAAEVARRVPDARLVTLPGAAHAINLDSPQELAEATLAFLRGTLPEPASLAIGSRIPSPKYVADFDSASAMLKANASALRGEGFPQVGNTVPVGAFAEPLASAIDALPQRLRNLVYIASGVAEAAPPDRIGDVRAEDISRWVVGEYPRRRYPAVAIGSSNGALTHLYAAMGIPWLPQTILIPIKTRLPVDEPRRDLDALRPAARALLDANPELELHHMHDPSQDRLMLHGMSYFRVKRRRLGETYARFLEETLEPGGTLFVVECRQSWPVTRVDDRHIFQMGAVGGCTVDEYFSGSPRVADFLRREGSPLRRWDPPAPDGEQPEAEWGFAPELRDDLERLAQRRGYRLRRIVFDQPMDTSPLVADLYRWWYERQGLHPSRLLVDSFVLMDPYWTLRTRSIPFWMTFNMQPSAAALERYVCDADPFDEIYLMLFSHGVRSVGLAEIPRWQVILDRARRRGAFVGVNTRAFPADFGTFLRYDTDLQHKIPARYPHPEPLTLADLDAFLAAAGGIYPVRWT